MPALDSEEDFIEDLAHVCRSLERHDWTDIDDIPSEKRGYGLIEACAKNPKGFKKCIKKIAYELQLQDLYVYKFYIKEIKDFGQTYRFILPMQNLMDPDAFVPSLIF